jgi:hypothetical protein
MLKASALSAALVLFAALPAAADIRAGDAVSVSVPDRGGGEPRLDRERLDPTRRDVPGQLLPAAEIDARRGWLAFTEIDDARDALRLGRPGQAYALIMGAQSLLEELSRTAVGARPARGRGDAITEADRALVERAARPGSRTQARLADALAALQAGDARAADRALADAEGELRAALRTLDAQLHPVSLSRLGIAIPP